MEPIQNKIPVGIITGFMGAGKTTLLNNLIREYPDKKFAIIENEFGEIGLDSELVLNVDNSNIYELANGCICCNLNDDLAGVVKDLLLTGKPFNYLLIETTGIADPSAVIQPFFSDQEIKIAFSIDAVICLADAMHFKHYFRQQEEVHQQLAIADLILLNKAEDVDEKSLADTMENLQSLNPQAEIIKTNHACINDRHVLGRNAYRADQIGSYALDMRALYGSGHGKTGHSISSYSFAFPGNFDIEKFAYWIEYFLYINQSNIFRIKGILSFADNPQKMILQSIRSSYLLEEWDYWEGGEERINRLVFIGREIPYIDIKEALESLMC